MLKKERESVKMRDYGCQVLSKATKGYYQRKESLQNILFSVARVDFLGPFRLKEREQKKKGYAAVSSCATSRAVYFTATKTIETIDEMYKRWHIDYVRSLRERNDITQKEPYYLELGEAALVVLDNKNKHERHHGIV